MYCIIIRIPHSPEYNLYDISLQYCILNTCVSVPVCKLNKNKTPETNVYLFSHFPFTCQYMYSNSQLHTGTVLYSIQYSIVWYE